MDWDTGRPDHIQDVMIRDHEGQWFGFGVDGSGKPREQVYANLLMLTTEDGKTYDKPTESYLTTELAAMQAAFDAQDYARNRVSKSDGYPSIGDQLDMIYHDQVNGTTTFKDAIKAVKDKYPKS